MHARVYKATRSSFWRHWVVASAIGNALGWAMFIPLYSGFIDLVNSVDQGNWSRAAAGACTWAIVFACSGVAQGLVLRRVFSQLLTWVAGALVGGLVYGFFSEVLFAAQGGVLVAATNGALAGAASGCVQWWTLRLYKFQLALWLPLSTMARFVTLSLGWALLERSIPFVARTLPLTSAWIVCGGLAGAMGGVVSGTALVWHLQSFTRQDTAS